MERWFCSSLHIKPTLRTLRAPEHDWQTEPRGSEASTFMEAEEEEEEENQESRGKKRKEPSHGLNKSKPVQARQTICNKCQHV